MGKAWTITDARGNVVELWRGGGPEQVLKGLSPTERRHVSDILWPDNFRANLKSIFNVTLFIACVAIAGGALGLLVAVLKPAEWPDATVGVIVGVTGAAGTAFVLRLRLRKLQRSSEYKHAMLQIKRCPACLYQLAGQHAERDGCVVCPECGGAWRQCDSEIQTKTVR